jgi:hypothetical protein
MVTFLVAFKKQIHYKYYLLGSLGSLHDPGILLYCCIVTIVVSNILQNLPPFFVEIYIAD